MENASKALIIAGAILLAIVIISLGLIVVNNVRDTVDKTNMSEQEIQAFNAKFTAYEGDNVSGSRVNTLIQQVIATNQASYNEGYTDRYVVIGYTPTQTSKTNPDVLLGFNNGKMVYMSTVINSTTSTTYINSGNWKTKEPTEDASRHNSYF